LKLDGNIKGLVSLKCGNQTGSYLCNTWIPGNDVTPALAFCIPSGEGWTALPKSKSRLLCPLSNTSGTHFASCKWARQ